MSFVSRTYPKQDNPYGRGDIGNPHLLTEVPVASCCPRGPVFLACQGICRATACRDCSRPSYTSFRLSFSPHIRPLGALNVVEHLGTREIAVKGEVARDGARDGVVDQLNTQLGVVRELPLLARVFFLNRRHSMG